MAPVPLPIGFASFHREPFLNYQFNRMYAEGYADLEESREMARRVRRLADAAHVLNSGAERAADEQRWANAASYMRAAHFFTRPEVPERTSRYVRFRAFFDEAFSSEALTRHEIPYRAGVLPVYHLAPRGRPKGAVLLHGGFDSLIEEFYCIWDRLAYAGYDVYAYEGPGQGGARELHGLTFEHDWEGPVGAILDSLGLTRATLVGISMGGYWALRAAGREPRIDRVVAWPPVYDWLEKVPSFTHGMIGWMTRRRSFMNATIPIRMRLFPILDHAVRQAMYLVDAQEPAAAVDWLMGMNKAHGDYARVTQPVLLLGGEEDTFQPPILLRKQAQALINAAQVHTRVFNAKEHAASHCQMGNLALACDTLTHWLDHNDLPDA